MSTNNFERREYGLITCRTGLAGDKNGRLETKSVEAHLLLAILEQLESIEVQITPTQPEKVKIKRELGLSVTAVVELWNEMFVDTYARQMEMITATRKASIQARIKNDFKTIGDWKGFFQVIEQSEFLMGKVQSSDRRPFKISLEWVCKPANLAKILEGHYHGR